MTRRENLVVVCAGDQSLHQRSHCHWAHASRTYDIATLYYGKETAKQKEYQTDSEYFHKDVNPKWTLIRNFLASCTHLHHYAFVAFPDDDLHITPTDWNRLFEIGRQHHLDLFQPSLVNNGPQYIKHTHLVSQPQNVLRFSNFVEIMVPVFSRRALNKAKGVLRDAHIKSGWGVDYVLPKAVLPHYQYNYPPSHHVNHNTYQVAVVDSVSITHTKPLGDSKQASKSSFYKTFDINPEAEMRYFMHKHKVKQFTPQTLRCVPVRENYATQFSTCATATPRPTRRASAANQTPKNKKNKTKATPNTTLHTLAHSHLTPVDSSQLPSYLASNIQSEWQAVTDHRHPQYKKTSDIHKFYHKITYGFHARIRHNQLRVIRDFGSYESRNINTLCMLHDVVCRYKIHDVDILVSTDDVVRSPDVRGVPILCMAKKASQTYMTYPDHSFYQWAEAHTGSWDTERANIANAHRTYPTTKKTPTAFFRGNVDTAYVRKHLARECAASKSKSAVLDVVDVKVGNHTTTTTKNNDTRKSKKRNTSKHRMRNSSQKAPRSTTRPSTFVSFAQHNRWKYLLHIPGRSYAARLKYLLMTSSVVFYVRKRPAFEYNEFWYNYLQNGVNCVIIDDGNLYNDLNRPIAKRIRGKKVWDDRANHRIVDDIHQAVGDFECEKRDYAQIVRNNRSWRETFDYELVLQYFAVVLNRISCVET